MKAQTMKTQDAKLLLDCRNQLGEGIQWNSAEQRVYWTDIFGNTIWSCDENGEHVSAQELEAGLCAFAFADTGRMLAAFMDGLYWFDLTTGQRDLILAYDSSNPQSRMNDGGLDRQGRFIVGGINEDGMARTTPVWSVDGTSPTPAVREIIQNIGCANSIVFSPDGQRMYFADTAGPDIVVYDYDTETGTPRNRQQFARLPEADGKPDGSCIDGKGGLWNARFGGACVQQFNPDGGLGTRIALPVPNVTCCCIGGKTMNRMFITTARLAMTEAALSRTPSAGGLYFIDLEVRGLDHGRFKAQPDLAQV